MTPQERLDYLLTDVWVPTNAVISLAVIRAALPQQAYGLVLVTLANAKKPQADTPEAIAAATEMEGVFIALNGPGISLSSPDRQAVIDQLAAAGQWPDAVRDAIKALGGVWRPRWQAEGYQSEPTLEQISKELIVSATRTAISSKKTAINAWLDAVDFSQYTEAELQAYCDALLASEDGNP